MNQDDIKYVLEILEDSIENQDWDLVKESFQYIKDFVKQRSVSSGEE